MNIGVIGCGYVGLVSAAGFAELRHNVVAAESDAARLKLLQNGQSPFHERHLPELLRKHAGARLQFRQSIEETVQQAKVVFICVGTPSLRSGKTDLSDTDAAVREISRCAALDLQRVRNPLRTPIVLDGRNLYSPCQMKAVGLNYISFGRPFALASSSAAGSLPLPSPTDNDLWTQDKGSSLGSATQRLAVPAS